MYRSFTDAEQVPTETYVQVEHGFIYVPSLNVVPFYYATRSIADAAIVPISEAEKEELNDRVNEIKTRYGVPLGAGFTGMESRGYIEDLMAYNKERRDTGKYIPNNFFGNTFEEVIAKAKSNDYFDDMDVIGVIFDTLPARAESGKYMLVAYEFYDAEKAAERQEFHAEMDLYITPEDLIVQEDRRFLGESDTSFLV